MEQNLFFFKIHVRIFIDGQDVHDAAGLGAHDECILRKRPLRSRRVRQEGALLDHVDVVGEIRPGHLDKVLDVGAAGLEVAFEEDHIAVRVRHDHHVIIDKLTGHGPARQGILANHVEFVLRCAVNKKRHGA